MTFIVLFSEKNTKAGMRGRLVNVGYVVLAFTINVLIAYSETSITERIWLVAVYNAIRTRLSQHKFDG